MDSGFIALLIGNRLRRPLHLTVFFDVLLAGTCLAPAFYLARTLIQIHKIEELSMLKYEWIPICMSGIFFALWVIETSFFDYTGMFSVETSGVRDATLFAAVSIFAIGSARFAETWGGYVKAVNIKRQMTRKSEPALNTVKEPV